MLARLDPDGSLEDERDRRRKSFVRLGVLPRALRVGDNATITLRELHEAAGLAHTAGQTVLPIRDLIRMAANTTSESGQDPDIGTP